MINSCGQLRERDTEMSDFSRKMRKEFKRNDDIRDYGLSTPIDIIRYDNILYGNDPVWNVLDVYRPESAGNKDLPVIVSVHGGGWIYGDKNRYQFYCMSLAQRGFAVVNFTYRLAPENKFPAAVEDTNSVFSWVLSHKRQYHFDTSNVFAVGDSAGAQILGIYTNICTNPEFAALFSFRSPEGFAPRAIALNCGVYDVTCSCFMEDGSDLALLAMTEYLHHSDDPEEVNLIDIVSHLTPAYPPVFLMTCTGDFFQKQTISLADKLMENCIPFIYRFYGNRELQLGHVFHCNIRSAEANICNDDECVFFKNNMIVSE